MFIETLGSTHPSGMSGRALRKVTSKRDKHKNQSQSFCFNNFVSNSSDQHTLVRSVDDSVVCVFLQAAVAVDQIHHVLSHRHRSHVDGEALKKDKKKRGKTSTNPKTRILVSLQAPTHRSVPNCHTPIRTVWTWRSPVWRPPRPYGPEPCRPSGGSIVSCWSVWSRREKQPEGRRERTFYRFHDAGQVEAIIQTSLLVQPSTLEQNMQNKSSR